MIKNLLNDIEHSIACTQRNNEESCGMIQEARQELKDMFLLSLRDCNNGGCIKRKTEKEVPV